MATIAKGKLSDSGVERLRAKLTKLNKRAVKLGKSQLTLEIAHRELMTTVLDNGLKHRYYINNVCVLGELPHLSGWEIAARIEFTEAGNLVHAAPGIDALDTKYRSIGNYCDHCHTKRRRNDVIVLRSADREMVVGRNCLADFVREGDAEYLIWLAQFIGGAGLIEDEDYERDYEQGEYGYYTSMVLEAASICIRTFGFTSKSKASASFLESTADTVLHLLSPPKYHRDEWRAWVEKHNLYATDYDTRLVNAALDWLKNADTSRSDYLHNLQLLVNMESVRIKHFGYLASLINTYIRATEKESAQRSRASIFLPYSGRVKNLAVTCTGIRSIEGYYGVSTLIKFKHVCDEGVANLTWFASGDKTHAYVVGHPYEITFTVKENREDGYGKQTIINRVTR